LKADELLPVLNGPEARNEKNLSSMWRPEYANYMIEGTLIIGFLSTAQDPKHLRFWGVVLAFI